MLARADGAFEIVAEDPADRIVEKADLETALVGVGLTESQRAMGALLSCGWGLREIAKVLHTNHTAVRRLRDGTNTVAALAARLEAFLNGSEEAP